MGFTYDLTATGDDLAISKVRLELGDTVEDAGVKMDGGNFSDAEIQVYLDANGSDITQTVGALCGVLARHWALAADITVGPRRESLSQVSKHYADMEAKLNPSQASFAIGVQRNDGYTENANGTEGEYA